MSTPFSGPLPDDVRIGELVNEGGVGLVHHVTLPDGTPAILKRLPKSAVSLESSIRFEREVALMSTMDLPGVPEVTHYNSDPSDLYIVMCHAPGEFFQDWQLPQGAVWARSLAEIMQRVLRVLHTVHKEGIMHRDLSPTNLKIDPRGQPWLLDFGLAVMQDSADLTGTSEARGTPRYMSPEQARGESHRILTPSTDLYSLALMFLGKAMGRPVRKGDNSHQIQQGIIRRDPDAAARLAPNLPKGLAAIFDVMLAHHPSDRFDSALTAAEALQAWMSGKTVSLPSMPLGRRMVRACRRPVSRGLLTGAFVLLSFSALSWRAWGHFAQAPLRAEIESMTLPSGPQRLASLRAKLEEWPDSESLKQRLADQTLLYQLDMSQTNEAYEAAWETLQMLPEHHALQQAFLSEAIFHEASFPDPYDALDGLRILALDYPNSVELRLAIETSLQSLLTCKEGPLSIEALALIEEILGPNPESPLTEPLLAIWSSRLMGVASAKYPNWGSMVELCLNRVSFGQAYSDAFYPNLLDLIHLDLNSIYRIEQLPARLRLWSSREPRLASLWLMVAHRFFMDGQISASLAILSELESIESVPQAHHDLASVLERWLLETRDGYGRNLETGWATSPRENEKWFAFLKEASALSSANKKDGCVFMWLAQLDKRNAVSGRYTIIDHAAKLQPRSRFAPASNTVRARLLYEEVEDAREKWSVLSARHKPYPGWQGLEAELFYAEGDFHGLKKAAILSREEGSDSLRLDVLDALASAHLQEPGALETLSEFLKPGSLVDGVDPNAPFREDPAFLLWLAEGLTTSGLSQDDSRWQEVERRWAQIAGGPSGNLLPVMQFESARRWGLTENSPLQYAPEPEWLAPVVAGFEPIEVLLVPQEYDTIQAAIDAAPNQSQVRVQAGEYSENLWVHHKSIQLVADGEVVIRAAGGQAPVLALTGCPQVEVIGFKLLMGGGTKMTRVDGGGLALSQLPQVSSGGGAYLWRTTCVFHECSFIGNGGDKTNFGGGLAVLDSSRAYLVGGTILGNTATSSGGGLIVAELSQAVLRGVQIRENHSSTLYGRQSCVSVGLDAALWLDHCVLDAAAGLPIATYRNFINPLGRNGRWYLRDCQVRGGYVGPNNQALFD